MTLNFTHECTPLKDKLKGVASSRQRYHYEEISDDVVAFKMINENATHVSC